MGPIEKGVPVPEQRRGQQGRWQRLAEQMSPNDSVLVDDNNERIALMRAIRKRNYETVSRRSNGGIRVWLTVANDSDG